MEVGQAGLIDRDGFAVDDEVFRLDRFRLTGKLDVSAGPIITVPGDQPDAVLVLDELCAVAIELDLMQPTVAHGWRVDKFRLHWLDELQTHALTPTTRDSISWS